MLPPRTELVDPTQVQRAHGATGRRYPKGTLSPNSTVCSSRRRLPLPILLKQHVGQNQQLARHGRERHLRRLAAVASFAVRSRQLRGVGDCAHRCHIEHALRHGSLAADEGTPLPAPRLAWGGCQPGLAAASPSRPPSCGIVARNAAAVTRATPRMDVSTPVRPDRFSSSAISVTISVSTAWICLSICTRRHSGLSPDKPVSGLLPAVQDRRSVRWSRKLDGLLRCIPPIEGGIRDEHTTAIQRGVPGECGAGGATRRRDDPRDRRAAQDPPEPSERVEAAGGGGDEGGLLEGGGAVARGPTRRRSGTCTRRTGS